MIFPFSMPRNAPFTFQPIMDGQAYTGEVRWNLFGQRPYVSLTDQNGQLTVSTAVVGSPDPIQISSMVWDGRRRKEIVTTLVPHGLNVGWEAEFVVSGVSPSSINGIYTMFAEDGVTLAFGQAVDLGAIAAQGVIGSEYDLTGGYFNTSRLIFRDSSQQFEVTP